MKVQIVIIVQNVCASIRVDVHQEGWICINKGGCASIRVDVHQ